MDNKLILAIVFLTLTWLSVDASSAACGNSTADATNSTTGSNTTACGNATTDTTNSTTGSNMTTTGNATTDTTNSTTGSNTTGNGTAAAAPPITPNVTVETLDTPISRDKCGSEQLCAAEPSTCNPSTAGSCFFLAVEQQSGQNFEFALSGQSEGYIAATLSTDSSLGGNDTTYVCANDNGVVKFFSTLLNNGQLIPTELNVNSVKGRISGGTIQCTFAATVPSPTTRATRLALGISTGPFNSGTGTLGRPSTRLRSSVVDLENPSTNVNNQISTSGITAAPTVAMTTNHAITLQQSLTQALLIIVGVLGTAVL